MTFRFWAFCICFILFIAGYSLGYKVSRLDCFTQILKMKGNCY